MSQDKVNSVPSDETAYARNRPGLGNGIAFINWNGRKPELEGEARHILEEVTGMVHVNGLRYGNYGASDREVPITVQLNIPRCRCGYRSIQRLG